MFGILPSQTATRIDNKTRGDPLIIEIKYTFQAEYNKKNNNYIGYCQCLLLKRETQWNCYFSLLSFQILFETQHLPTISPDDGLSSNNRLTSGFTVLCLSKTRPFLLNCVP